MKDADTDCALWERVHLIRPNNGLRLRVPEWAAAIATSFPFLEG